MKKDRERRQELAAALRGVLDHQNEAAASVVAAAGRQGRNSRNDRKLVYALLAVSWGFIAWVWLAKPAFIFANRTVPASAEVREASLRFGLYLQRSRIDRFAAEFGRLPATLTETGDPIEDGVTYVPHGDLYTLVGRDSTLELQLTNRMSVDSFLGSSLDVLRGAGPVGPQ